MSETKQEPRVGDDVFMMIGGRLLPAKIVHVYNLQVVNLQVFLDSSIGLEYRTSVRHNVAPHEGEWSFEFEVRSGK